VLKNSGKILQHSKATEICHVGTSATNYILVINSVSDIIGCELCGGVRLR
jgi:hypothetical protein